MTLTELVNEHYNELNENDLYIWQYICHHKIECQNMSIHELARSCNVSHTSITRFTRKIGLDGYSELKVYLKWSTQQKSTFNYQILSNIPMEFKRTIDHIYDLDLDRILLMIDTARHIYICSSGEVQRHVAQELKREFTYCKKIFYVIEGDTEIDNILANVTSEDLFILISLSGNNEKIALIAKVLAKMKVQCIGIASGHHNLLAQHASEYISFESTGFETGFLPRTYHATSHFFIIVDMLFLKYLQFCSLKDEYKV